MEDITGQERNNEKLCWEEDQYRLLFERNPQPMWVQDEETLAFLAVNEAAIRHYGYTREEFLRMTVKQIRRPESVPALLSAIQSQRGRLVYLCGVWEHRKKDDTPIQMEITVSAIVFQGHAARLVMANDVTERQRAEQSLREREERYRLLAESASDAIYMVGRDRCLRYVNSYGAGIMGFRPEEMIGKPLSDLFPASFEQMWKQIELVLSSGTPRRVEEKLPHAGSDLWLDTALVPFRDSTGEVDAVMGISHDLTLRRRMEEEMAGQIREQTAELRAANERLRQQILHREQAEAALRANEARLRSITSNAPIILFSLDRDGRFVFSEGRGLALMKRKPGEVDGKSIFDLYGHLPGARDAIRRALDGENVTWIGEIEGAIYECSSTPLRTARGEPNGLIGVAVDVTQRERALKAARDSEGKYRDLVEQMSDGVFMADETGRFAMINPAGCRILGCVQEKALQLHVADTYADGEKRAGMARLKRSRKGMTQHFERMLRRVDGSLLPVEVSLTRLGDGRAVAITRDITERKQLEKAVAEVSEQERQRLGRDLHDGLAQHLTAIGFWLCALEQSLAVKSLREASEVAKIGERVKEAVAQTQELARGLYPLILKTQGLVPGLRELASTVQDMFPISCRFRCRTAIPDLDPETARQIYRIAQEAAYNSAKHSKGKHVQIRLSASRNQITLTVNDDGVGISRAGLKRKNMGIHIMKYRAAILGATLEIRRRSRRGTSVICSFKQQHRENQDQQIPAD